MERNQHISLAHINPESFIQLESQKEPNVQCTMWFIGLEFIKTENLNVDLTHDIQKFTETVMNNAVNINMLKEGMKLEARHVRRKELHQYLAPSYLRRERKISVNNVKNGTDVRKRSLEAVTTNVTNTITTNCDSGTTGVTNKRTRLSEEVCFSFKNLVSAKSV